MGTMQVWPAIDLRGGQCVRLVQGDFDRETVFGSDPAAMARHWVEEGAQCLHLVDLDGARAGQPQNLASVEAILSAVSVPCELGGGIRDQRTIDLLLNLGLSRVILGTSALAEPDWFRRMCRQYAGRLVLGLDAREGRVATSGWLKTSDVAAVDLARQFVDEPLGAIIYTDIAADGMLAGPSLKAMEQMRGAVSVSLVASGGVAGAADVARLAELGLDGVIIGRALYERTLTLSQALAAARLKAPLPNV